jgi:hypothetical protein
VGDGEAKGPRTLIWVPIIHTQEDMGSLREAVRRQFVERYGQAGWDEHVRAVDAIWAEIRRRLDALALDPARTRLYQDGLPVCGQEEAIVRDLARSGSRNHRLLVDLMDRGAHLTGTESAELLMAEYQLAVRLAKGATGSANGSSAAMFADQGRSLLERRDQFIADQIDRTLEPGESGVVFLGMLHNLKGRLPGDIAVTRLDVREAAGR